MRELFTIYGNILIEFLAEFYVFCAFFFVKFHKNRYFVPKFLLGLLGVLGLSLPVAWFYTLFGDTIWGRVLVYVVMYLLVLLHTKLSFDISIWKSIFSTSMAYAAQNLTYKLFLIFWSFGIQNHLFDTWGRYFDLWYRIVYYTFFFLIVLLLYFVVIRKINNKIQSNRLDMNMLFLTVTVLVITVILCSMEDICFASLSSEVENQFADPRIYVVRQTGNIFSAICCFVVLILATKTIIERELMQEVAYLKYYIKQGERQYEISKDTIELINIKIHDIKYKINSVLAEHEGISQDTIDELRKSVRIYDANVETGNELLNVFITDKSLYCEQNGITLSCMIDGAKLDFMEPGDLYCLFGNIVDNALESVIKIEKKEKRVINLTVKTKNDMLFIQADNYFIGNIKFKDGLPQTTKENTGYHGFGMQSIRMIAQKYGGDVTAYVKDDIFHLNILFGNISNPDVQNV